MRKQISILVLLFGLQCLLVNSHAQESLLLTTFAGPPLSKADQTGLYDLILKEAFHRVGRTVRVDHLPAERSLTNANAGITDGDFVRIFGLEHLYPNLIQVPEKMTDFEFVAFTWKPDIRVKDWAGCKPYHVAIVRGWKILELNLAHVTRLIKVKDQYLLFNLLAKKRVDIAVYSRFEGYEMIKQLGLQSVHALEPPLAAEEMFLYLNRKHRALVAPLAKQLRYMKQDGTFDRLVNRTLKPYLEKKPG